MNKILQFNKVSEEEYEINRIFVNINKSENDYKVIINFKDKRELLDILNTPHLLNDISNYARISSEFFITAGDLEKAEVYKEFADYIILHTDIVSAFDIIAIDGSIKTIKDFIDNNPKTSYKNVSRVKSYRFSEEGLEKAKSDLEIIPNLVVRLHGAHGYITVSEFEDSLNIINNIVAKIDDSKLSTLEKVLCAYDFIRDRVYVEESELEHLGLSRDVSSVLLGDKIVCAGYANVFNTILSKLGIKCTSFKLKCLDGTTHARSLVRILDEKYGIEGLYFFDPTFDSRTIEMDNKEFLSKLSYFALTSGEIKELDGIYFKDETYKYLYRNKINKLLRVLSDQVSIIEASRYGLYSGTSTLLNLCDQGEDRTLKTKKEVEEILEYLYNESNKNIPIEVLVSVVHNARKHMSEVDSCKFEMDYDDLKNTLFESKVMAFDSSREREALVQLLGEEAYSSLMYGITSDLVDKQIKALGKQQ